VGFWLAPVELRRIHRGDFIEARQTPICSTGVVLQHRLLPSDLRHCWRIDASGEWNGTQSTSAYGAKKSLTARKRILTESAQTTVVVDGTKKTTEFR